MEHDPQQQGFNAAAFARKGSGLPAAADQFGCSAVAEGAVLPSPLQAATFGFKLPVPFESIWAEDPSSMPALLWLCLIKTLKDATLGVHEVGETARMKHGSRGENGNQPMCRPLSTFTLGKSWRELRGPEHV